MDGTVAVIGQKVDPESQIIEIDGVPLPVAGVARYYLLYKPRGVVTTSHDPQGRPTVVDLVPDDPRVYPVGRLDSDSEGLLLLTNDGELTNRLTHPRYGVEKIYLVLTSSTPTRADLRRLLTGVDLEDGLARAEDVRLVDQTRSRSQIEIVMREGRNREVRRMLGAIGLEVDRLVRVGIGPLRDSRLSVGSWRELKTDEVRELYSAAQLSWDDASDR